MPHYNNELPIDLQKNHSVLYFDNLEAPQSKHMLLSALLIVQSRPNWLNTQGKAHHFLNGGL